MARALEQARGMHSTEPMGPPPALTAPTFGEMLEEIVPVIGVVVVVAPPVIFIAGPWLLMGLLLSGPFALVVALVAVAMALVALAGAIVAILAAPYLLVRSVRERRARHAAAEPDAPLVSLDSPRVAA
jgi:heme exporter protein D